LETSLPLEFHLKYFEDDYELKLIFVAVSRVSGRLSKANSRIPRKVLEPSDGSGLAKKAREEWVNLHNLAKIVSFLYRLQLFILPGKCWVEDVFHY